MGRRYSSVHHQPPPAFSMGHGYHFLQRASKGYPFCRIAHEPGREAVTETAVGQDGVAEAIVHPVFGVDLIGARGEERELMREDLVTVKGGEQSVPRTGARHDAGFVDAAPAVAQLVFAGGRLDAGACGEQMLECLSDDILEVDAHVSPKPLESS